MESVEAAATLAETDQPSPDSKRAAVMSWRSHLRHPALGIALIDLLLVLGFGIFSTGHAFFNGSNFTNMSLDAAQIVLLSVGSAVLLASAELDISLGANVILSSVVGGRAMVSVADVNPDLTGYKHAALGIFVGVVVAIATGVVFGIVNGLVVTRLRVNSFITTLGTLGIGTGLALAISGGSNVEGIPATLQDNFGIKSVANVPLPALVTAVLVLIIGLIITFTRFGMHTLAIGSSRPAAARAGIGIDGHVFKLFVIVGFLGGVCGVMDISRFATTNLSGHQTDALAAIAGAVIGGTSLFGGRISVLGAVFGALLAVILQTGLVILGLQPFYQQVAIGAVLILAVFLRSNAARRSLKGGMPGAGV